MGPIHQGHCCTRETSNFDRLWDDFIQEEIQEESLAGQQVGDDENLALATQARRRRGNTSGELAPQAGKKKDLGKVKCFACHKSGQYDSQFSNKKNGKSKSVEKFAEAQVKEFVEKFEKEFSLVSCLSGTDSSGA
jgi:hypothetical protein